MDIKKQLLDGEATFSLLENLIKEKKYKEFYETIAYTPPPDSWIIELPTHNGEGKTYKTIKFPIMEAAMKRIFGDAGLSTISSPIISQDKSGKFCSTVVVTYKHKCPEGGFDGWKTIPGIASVSANSISQLEIASPKASTIAAKNAIKQLGAFFGKYLNEEDEVPEVPIDTREDEPLSPEQEHNSVKDGILKAKSKRDLQSWRMLVYKSGTPHELQELYETRLREFQ